MMNNLEKEGFINDLQAIMGYREDGDRCENCFQSTECVEKDGSHKLYCGMNSNFLFPVNNNGTCKYWTRE